MQFGSYRLGKYSLEVAAQENTVGKLPLRKIQLGSCRLEKYSWEVAALENACGKVPNIEFLSQAKTFQWLYRVPH